MGSILDTSVIITCERAGLTGLELLERVSEFVSDEQVGLTTVVVTELLHGIYRARDANIRRRREIFLERLFTELPVYAYTLEIATLAGRIGGEQGALGYKIPFADLSIGATAVSLGYSVLTSNERHLRMIPGLKVIAF